jgi:hypothetical protein
MRFMPAITMKASAMGSLQTHLPLQQPRDARTHFLEPVERLFLRAIDDKRFAHDRPEPAIV